MSQHPKRNRRRPTHPGELLREETLPAAGLSASELAVRLGVSNRGINDLLRERRAVNPDLAHRLTRVLNTTPGVLAATARSGGYLGCVAS